MIYITIQHHMHITSDMNNHISHHIKRNVLLGLIIFACFLAINQIITQQQQLINE